MTSIVTNSSSLAALQTLRSIHWQLSATQGQVSSGLSVATASDNAAYWSISTTMRSDSMAISAVSDALGLGAAKVEWPTPGWMPSSMASAKSRRGWSRPRRMVSTRPRFSLVGCPRGRLQRGSGSGFRRRLPGSRAPGRVR
ncbi:flagellin N-terminal helical domain-containing protein [Sinorhizobium meliloti]|uniref:flagellin N-terminal helical domain-containing protein n=1 Tax=Rhizobium meliloti TaxID=382 RepID=UPI003989BB88